jgi:Arc/MetJ-type ribon-helix-helix transcriptional regulator
MHIHMAMTAVPSFLEFRIMAVSTEAGIIVNSLLWLNAEGKCRNPGKRLYDNFVLCHNKDMSRPARRASRVFTISFPEELAKQVVAVADEESRNISELFREAFRAYRFERIHNKLDVIRAEAAKRVTHHYTEDDVEALVDEIRSENFRKRKQIA